MSVTGIASSILAGLGGAQGSSTKSQQIQSEFSSLAQDLQTGNLQKAQTDFTALAKNLPGLSQASGQTSGTTANSQNATLNINQIIGQLVGQTISQSLGQTPVPSVGQTASPSTSLTGSTTTASPLLQAFNQLGQDLQSGNLQGAQQDLTAIQQAAQPTSTTTAQSNAQTGTQHAGRFHHHHHRAEGSGDSDQLSSSSSSSSSSTSSSQQPLSLEQAFKSLAQDLQSGNLHGAQQAFSALQTDLQQIGGIVTGAAATKGSTAASASTAGLNVSA